MSELLTYFDSMYVSRAIRRSSQTNDGVCFCTYTSRRRSIHPECGTCTLLPLQAWRRQTMSVRGGTIRSMRWLGGHQHPALWTWVLCNRMKRWLQPPSCSMPEASRRWNVRSTPPCSSSSACTICAAAVVTALSLLLTRFMHWDIASDCSRVGIRGRPYDSGSCYKLLTSMMPLFVDLLLF